MNGNHERFVECMVPFDKLVIEYDLVTVLSGSYQMSTDGRILLPNVSHLRAFDLL